MQAISLRALCAAAWILSGSVGAGAAEPQEFPQELGGEKGKDFIEIPGVGRIPIPPGVNLFEPPQAQREPPPKPPPPKPPESPLDALLARLKNAADEPEAQAIALKIQGLFASNPSDTLILLSMRAAAAEMSGAAPVALALLDHVIALDPHWSEGFVRRARLLAANGDAVGAKADFRAALRLEPRRFDALAALGALEETGGDKKSALDAYRRALALDPQQSALQKAEERLRLDVEGRDI